MTQTYTSGGKLYLSRKLNPADTTMYVTTNPNLSKGRLYASDNLQQEWIQFTTATATGIGTEYALGGLTRGLSQTSDPATAGTGKTWLSPQIFVNVAMHDQEVDKQEGFPPAKYTTAQLNARTGKTLGEIFWDTTQGGPVYWNGSAYVLFPNGGSIGNATTITTGVVQLGNQTDIDNVVDAGSIGPNVVIPSTLDAKVMKQTSLVNSGITGEVKMWTTATPPTNWLICDGSSLLRAGTYAALFAVIGTTYGTADATHFNIPDFRGRSPIGSGTGTATGATAHALGATPTSGVGGEEKHTLLLTEIPAHTHDTTFPTTLSGGGSHGLNTNDATPLPFTSSSAGGGLGHNIMGPHTAINFIIRI